MIVLDIETTGWRVDRCGIIAIGAVDFSNPKNQFFGECRIDESTELDESAIPVHGFTREQLLDPSRQSEASLIKSFDAWATKIAEKTLAGHNVGFFDRSFLLASYERHNLTWKYSRRTIDLHTVAWVELTKQHQNIPKDGDASGLKLDEILTYLGLPTEPKPHTAINGARYEAEAFSRLIYGKNLLPEFEQYPVKEYYGS